MDRASNNPLYSRVNFVEFLCNLKCMAHLNIMRFVVFNNAGGLEMLQTSSEINLSKHLTIPSSLLTLGKILGQGMVKEIIIVS